MEKQEMKEWEIYQLINRIIYDLNEENISQSVQRMFDIFDDNYPYSFNIVTSHGIYTSFVAQIVNSNIIFDFLNELEKMLNENNKMFDVLYHFLAKKYTNEARYLINEILENEYFKPKFFILFTPYFAHYNLNKNLLYNHYKNDEQFKYFFENYEVLSKNDWELHKKLIKEGHNPNEITKIIRNDEIEKLQEISSQTNFDYNQTIEPSLYERCSFINKRDVSLIDYAAFFGSIQCFKYLLMNGSKLENTGKYAVANGNEEIIHLCEQNHSTFKDAYKAAIKFHKNNISKYLYDNRNEDINNLEELGKKCVSYNNLDVFLILHKEGMKINNDIINEFARVGNIFLIKHFLRENEIPKDILVFSSASGNIELVKHILKQEGIDINAKNKRGNTALMFASLYGNIEIVNLLLEQEGIDINAKNNYGYTALVLAAESGNIEIVKLLLEHEGIDINAKGKDGNTALIVASYNGNIEIVKLLIAQKGIDINAKNNWGRTALMFASYVGHTEIVKLLLNQEGIDINAKSKNGETALNLASREGHTKIVKILLEQEGIDI